MTTKKPWIMTKGGSLDDAMRVELTDSNGRIVSSTWVLIPTSVRVTQIDSHAVWQANGGETTKITAYRFMLWHDVEQIAAYVRSFSDDPVCQVLADAILEGRR